MTFKAASDSASSRRWRKSSIGEGRGVVDWGRKQSSALFSGDEDLAFIVVWFWLHI